MEKNSPMTGNDPIAYIQFSDQGLPLNRNIYAALEGLIDLGHQWKPFQVSDILQQKLKINEGDLLVGNIPVVRLAIEQQGKIPPEPFDYPKCLHSFLGRKVQKTTFSNAWKLLGQEDEKNGFPNPLFIKPVPQKSWTGKVFRSFKDLITLGSIDGDFPVWISTPVKFETEYRCYILNGRLEAIKHYNGNPFLVPDREVVENMVQNMNDHESIVAYSLDVGVSDGKTLLVEVNDAYALGNYGVSSTIYAKMLLERWRQITAGM